MKKVVLYFLLGLSLAAFELAAVTYTKVLDSPWLFIVLLFSSFFSLSLIILRRKGNALFFLFALSLYLVGIFAYYLFFLKNAGLPILLGRLFFYFLLYAWPALFGVIFYIILRELLRPVPPRSMRSWRLEKELRLKAQKRRLQGKEYTEAPDD